MDTSSLLFTLLIFVGLIGFIILVVVQGNRISAATRIAEQIARREKDEEAYRLSQIQLRTALQRVVADSELALDEVRKKISEAEKALAQAELEFEEGAFAPFWDVIEVAANHLAQSNSGIEYIIQKSEEYLDGMTNLDSDPPVFQFGVGTLPDTTRTTDRMRIVVRNAQKNFHFATIYEQRKTNKLLIAGFTNLADALNSMGERLELSVQALSLSLTEIGRKMEENWDAQREYEEKQLYHKEKELEMLDNIQRRKRPWVEFPDRFE